MSYNHPVADTSLIACLHCDLLQRIPELAPGASARCPRCNKELWRHREDSLNRTFALTLAAVVLYIVANSVPMLGLTIVGRDASTTVIGGAQHLWDNGQKIVGVLVLFTAVIAPALQIGLMLAIVLGARLERPPRWVGTMLRYHPTTRIWSMIEVMMVGVLVALVKIADYAALQTLLHRGHAGRTHDVSSATMFPAASLCASSAHWTLSHTSRESKLADIPARMKTNTQSTNSAIPGITVA